MATDPFIGEIRLFAISFPPVGWALCDGSLIKITQNAALFSLIGTNFGGNGTTDFALPNLIGRVPLGAFPTGAPYWIGTSGGETDVAMGSPDQLPVHSHPFMAATAAATTATATGSLLALGTAGTKNDGYVATFYSPNSGSLTPMAPNAISPSGRGMPHANMQPYIVLNFYIALTGIFPSRPPS